MVTLRKIKKMKSLERKARELRDRLDAIELQWNSLADEIMGEDKLLSQVWIDYCKQNNDALIYDFSDTLA